MVARVTRSFGPASIMAKSLTPAASARNSVCPGNWNPARPAHSFEMGAVTRPRALPCSTASVAARRYATWARPLVSLGCPGRTSSAVKPVTALTRSAGGAGTPATRAARASTPGSPNTSAWIDGRSASARTTTSGPMPAGSPSEIARGESGQGQVASYTGVRPAAGGGQ